MCAQFMWWGSVGLSLQTAHVVSDVKIGGLGTSPVRSTGRMSAVTLAYQAL